MEMNTVNNTACTGCMTTIKNKIPEAFYPYNIACKPHASIIEMNMDLRKLFRQKISDKRNIRVLSFDGEMVIGKVLDIHQSGFRLKLSRPINVDEKLEGLIETSYGKAMPHYIPFTASCVWSNLDEAGFRYLNNPSKNNDMLDILSHQFKMQKTDKYLQNINSKNLN